MHREAICIGVDVAAGNYGRRLRTLKAAALDAETLAGAAERRAFSTSVLAAERATLENVRRAIAAAAARLHAGDTFLIAFSGHGLAAQTPFGFQQSWCLYDTALLRFGMDGLDAQLALFAAGVRICILMNCCHAGSDWGLTPATPRSRAHVVRIAACGANDVAWDAREGETLSPFVRCLVDTMQERQDDGIFGFFRRLAAQTEQRPELEINHPRSESFLREGF